MHIAVAHQKWAMAQALGHCNREPGGELVMLQYIGLDSNHSLMFVKVAFLHGTHNACIRALVRQCAKPLAPGTIVGRAQGSAACSLDGVAQWLNVKPGYVHRVKADRCFCYPHYRGWH